MKFYMPTKLYSESHCVQNHAAELAALGKHALIVTGQNSSKQNGSLADVTNALSEHHVQYTIFDRVEENPSVETVMAARTVGLECRADFVIGIGGGSPLDAAKAAALMMRHPEQEWQYLYEPSDSSAFPIAAVPTTCGTGSEVTGVSVLTRHDLQTKVSMTHKVFPTLALVDGTYILNAPRRILVNTAVDALSHLIESCVNTSADLYSDMTAFAGLRMWGRCRPYIEGKTELTASAAQALMDASALAGMSIAQTGTSIPHALSYLLTYHGKIPHGTAVGMFQAGFLQLAEESRRNAVLQAAGFTEIDDLRQLIQALLPVQVEHSLLEQAAEAVLHHPAKLKTCPYPVNADVMQKIIADCKAMG